MVSEPGNAIQTRITVICAQVAATTAHRTGNMMHQRDVWVDQQD
jgi:hypothetical protein